MSNKKMMRFEVELPFPEGDISCEGCKFMARSCVGPSLCMVTGSVVDLKSQSRNANCPLKPIE